MNIRSTKYHHAPKASVSASTVINLCAHSKVVVGAVIEVDEWRETRHFTFVAI